MRRGTRTSLFLKLVAGHLEGKARGVYEDVVMLIHLAVVEQLEEEEERGGRGAAQAQAETEAGEGGEDAFGDV